MQIAKVSKFTYLSGAANIFPRDKYIRRSECMEAREELTRLIAWLVQQVDGVDSEQLKADIA